MEIALGKTKDMVGGSSTKKVRELDAAELPSIETNTV
jgi:hypothetical protein